MYVLRQQAVPISHSKRVDEHVTSLIAPANFPQCIDQPEPANQKCRLGQAKIISSNIPHNVETAPKFISYGVDCCHKTWVFRRYQTELCQQERTRVEIIAVECRGKGLPLGIPAAFEHFRADAFGDPAPVGGAFRQIE